MPLVETLDVGFERIRLMKSGEADMVVAESVFSAFATRAGTAYCGGRMKDLT